MYNKLIITSFLHLAPVLLHLFISRYGNSALSFLYKDFFLIFFLVSYNSFQTKTKKKKDFSEIVNFKAVHLLCLLSLNIFYVHNIVK